MTERTTASAALRSLVLPLYLPMVFLSMGMAAPTPAFPQYLAGLGATIAAVGVIVSLKGVGHILSDLPGGLIIQRLGVRTVVICSYVVSILSAVAIAVSTSLFLISIAKTVMGFSNAVITLGMMAYARQTVASAHRGRALSFAGGSLRIGMLAGPLVGGLLADAYGVSAAFLFQAGATGLGLVLTSFGMRRAPGATYAAGRAPEAASPLTGLSGTVHRLRNGLSGQGFKLTTVGFSVFTLMLLRAARQIIMPLWGDALGMGPALIGQIMSASAAIELLLVVPAGFIMDRAGRKVAASLCIGVLSIGVMLLPLSTGVVGFLLLGLVIGVGNGFGSGINMTIGTDLAPDQAIGEFLGLWRMFGDVGAAIGPVVVGAVAGAVTLPFALVLTGGVGIAGMAVMAFIAPETRDEDPAAAEA